MGAFQIGATRLRGALRARHCAVGGVMRACIVQYFRYLHFFKLHPEACLACRLRGLPGGMHASSKKARIALLLAMDQLQCQLLALDQLQC